MKRAGPTIPPETQEIMRRAQQHQRDGRLAEAAALCRHILSQQPRHAPALNLAGIVAVQCGRLARGRDLLAAAADAQPEAAPYQADLAQALLLAGEEAAAAKTYRHCLALDPGFVPAWLNLGTLMLKADRIEGAGDCFEKAIEVKPELAEAHAGLGFVRQRQHRTADAIGAFEHAAALAPRDGEIRSNLGGLLLQSGEHERAIACFQRAIALVPEQASLHTHLGIALHQARGAAAALPDYQAALRLAPGDTRTLAAKGAALAALDRRSEAARIFDHDALLATKQIAAAPGDADMAAFNGALAALAAGHPTLMAERPGTTTRGGGQIGELFGPASGPMAKLEALIRGAVREYFADPQRTRHPHCPRRPARGRLTAWATVLDSGGYQDPHHHPSGLLSGVYYVRVPDADAAADAGAIEFGRASAAFGNQAAPEVVLVRPREGLMVLFPSFFWHRTIPFRGDSQRISIAFDLIPEA